MRALPTLLLGVAWLAGCSEQPAESGHDHGVAPLHGPPTAVPGSYEDWCDQHEVPESKCTRCDPKLIAAFKARSDWCRQHFVPESQCLTCNRDLKIVRPPRPRGQ